MWFNEAAIAPYFLRHYSFADRIHILVDVDTTDATRELCDATPGVTWSSHAFPDMLDDEIKAASLTRTVTELAGEYDWIVVVDADELVFARSGIHNLRAVLVQQSPDVDVLWVPMWQVYRHAKSEKPLDPDGDEPVLQRRHGEACVHHVKAAIVRPEAGVILGPGCHSYAQRGHALGSGVKYVPAVSAVWADSPIIGAHWPMVDEEMAVDRYLRCRRERLSKANLQRRHGVHYLSMTEASVREECRAHANDLRLW